jgi:MFS family permease
MMTGYGIVMPVFAKRLGELGSGVAALGLMSMGFAFAQFVLSPFLGSFADRFGRKPFILMALAGEVVANPFLDILHVSGYTMTSIVSLVIWSFSHSKHEQSEDTYGNHPPSCPPGANPQRAARPAA